MHRQAIQGRLLVFGQEERKPLESKVFRMIDQKPVYHVSTSDFDPEDFNEVGTKPRLFGKFYNTPQLLDQKVSDAKLIFCAVLGSILV